MRTFLLHLSLVTLATGGIFAFAACGSSSDDESSSTSPTDTDGSTLADGSSTGNDDGSVSTNSDGSVGLGDASSTEDAAPKPWADPLTGTAAVTLVQGGFAFTEGPLWRAATSDLLFQDVLGNVTKKLVLPNTITNFRSPSGYANGLALDQAKKVVACEGSFGGRRVSRENAGGAFDLVLDSWMGKKLNSPNDVIVRSDGTIYFTDPDYGLVVGKEQTFNGVYRIAPNGTPSLVANDLAMPNGIALSPNEKILYVADESAGKIYKFDVASDGSTSNKALFVSVAHPDGITVNDQGDVFAAAETGVEVFKADGTSLGKKTVAEQPANVAFGGADRKTLFITARTGLYKVELNVAGPP